MNYRRGFQRGFTLIEVLVVVVIVSILAAIALPSFDRAIAKSRRAAAESALMQNAQWMEKYYTQNNTYMGATVTTLGFPCAFSPCSNAEAGSHYTITLNNVSAGNYTLVATPKANSVQARYFSAPLTLDGKGRKTGEW